MKNFLYFGVFTMFLSLSAVAPAAEMFYASLAKDDDQVPGGTYYGIVVPKGGYRATKFSTEIASISKVTTDSVGSFANIIISNGTSCDIASHTISGWFKVPKMSSGEKTIYLAKASDATSGGLRGYGVRITSGGYLDIGIVRGDDSWQSEHFLPTSTPSMVELDGWFYLTVSVAVDRSARKASVQVFVNGTKYENYTPSFSSGLNGSACVSFKVGDEVSCAGLRIDDEAVTNTTTIKSWAVNPEYVVSRNSISVPDAQGTGSFEIPENWVTAYLDMSDVGSEAIAAKLAAPRETGNRVPLRDCYVLKLDPHDPRSIPYLEPIQTQSSNEIMLRVKGGSVRPGTAANVRYQLMERSAGGSYESVGSPQTAYTFTVSLPASGVRYYRIEVVPTASSAQ